MAEFLFYWERRHVFSNLKDINKFIKNANNLLFKELSKVNELLIEIYPECRRLLLFSKNLLQHTIQNKLNDIEELINYCFYPKGAEKGFHAISKLRKFTVNSNFKTTFLNPFAQSNQTQQTVINVPFITNDWKLSIKTLLTSNS